jgi:integrase
LADTRYLEKVAGEKWRVIVAVPKKAQAALGKTVLKRSLNTDSLTEANRLKWDVVAEMRAEINAALTGRTTSMEALASFWRQRLATLPSNSDEAEMLREEIEITADSIAESARRYTQDITEEPIDRKAEDAAGQFAAVALGKQTPLTEPLAKFHAQGRWNNRTKADSARAVSYLTDWCKLSGTPATLEALTRKKAGEFIGALTEGTSRPDKRRKAGRTTTRQLANRTINKYISCLSSYWEWLAKRGYLPDESNVWERQSLPKEVRPQGEKEREFTQTEMAQLLNGTPLQPYMKPLMMIAALTGARIGAIIALRAMDIEGDCIRFAPQKRETDSRLVPIHPALTPVIQELLKGKEPQDDLFPECPRLKPTDLRERSMPAVKAFGRYREKLGVDAKAEGRIRGLVNFHSFRRWFITEALKAGQQLPIVQAVVGHKHDTVTLRHYHGGFAMEQLRACVEAVKLPA